MQIHVNGTLFFFYARLTQRVFSVWPVAQPVVGEMEMHSVANLATLQTPLATFFFFFFKKAPKPSFCESPVLQHEALLSQTNSVMHKLNTNLSYKRYYRRLTGSY